MAVMSVAISVAPATGIASNRLTLAAWAPAFQDEMPRQETLPPKADPGDIGLRLTIDNVRRPENEFVLVSIDDEEPVVAKVYLETSRQYAVILPTGRLTAVPREKATKTDRPFESIEKDEFERELIEGKFKGFKTKSTRHYLFVYNTSELFADTTARILETMYPALYAYCRRQRIDVHEPETPLVVIMFRTDKEFQEYRRMPDGVLAYYNTLSNYVIMYEQSSLADAAPLLAVKQSISTVAHEGVHQILHNIGVQHRLSEWPAWISEGLPEFFAPTSIDRNIRWKGVGLVNDLRMHSLINRLRADDPSIANGGLIKQTINANQLNSDDYAASWALTYYLAKHQRRDFFAYLKDVSELLPLDNMGPSSEELFVKHFGDDFAGLQDKMLAMLSRERYVDPVENQPHYVVFFQSDSRRASVVTTSPSSVNDWRQQILASIPPAERATARFAVQIYGSRTEAKAAAQQRNR